MHPIGVYLTCPGKSENSLSSDRSTGTCLPPCSCPASSSTDWALSFPLLSQHTCPSTVMLSWEWDHEYTDSKINFCTPAINKFFFYHFDKTEAIEPLWWYLCLYLNWQWNWREFLYVKMTPQFLSKLFNLFSQNYRQEHK